MPAANPFRRELDSYVVVAVDGEYDLPLDPVYDPDATDPVPRVVVTMPHFVAHTYSHSLKALSGIAFELNSEQVGPDEANLALALYDAAAAAGYRCTDRNHCRPPQPLPTRPTGADSRISNSGTR